MLCQYQQRLIVIHRGEADVREVTSEISVQAEKPNIVAVSSSGVVSTVGNGSTELRIRFAKKTVLIPVTVTDAGQHAPVSFNTCSADFGGSGV